MRWRGRRSIERRRSIGIKSVSIYKIFWLMIKITCSGVWIT